MSHHTKRLVDSNEAATHALTLLREQASLYRKLESFAKRQRGLVLCEDTGPLLAMLGERAKLSERLAAVGSQLAPIRKTWDAFRARLSPGQRAEAEQLVHDAGLRLQRVIESDEQDVRVLSGRKQEVSDSLGKTHATSRAINAYRVTDDATNRLDCVTQGT